MKELRDILQALEAIETRGETAALATVVKIGGSTYRRPGARMLILQDGGRIGAISGGCLEEDVAEYAKLVMESGEPLLQTYDMTAEEEAVGGLGLGCNGIVHVLIERVPDDRSRDWLHSLHQWIRQAQPGVLATVFNVEGSVRTRIGDRLTLEETLGGEGGRGRGSEQTGTVSPTPQLTAHQIEDSELAEAIQRDALQVFQQGRTQVQVYTLSQGSAEVLLEVLQPVSLVLFGAGYDAIPVAQFAKALGWHVTIVDNRPAYATPEHFPQADAIIVCRPEETQKHVPLNARTVAIVMNHNYGHDLELLKTLLPSPVRYLGVLGPKKRTERLLQAVKEQGVEPTEAQLKRLYSPVGIDIGAETPEEIALSALAEIQAVLAGRSGGFLRERKGGIH